MKQYSIIAFIAFSVFLSACYKDKGNYDYKEINEITIGGLANTYSVIYGVDVLHIEPDIKMTETITDPSRLSYYWILVKGTTRLDTLGTAPVLDYPVDITPDTYVLTLRIVDNETGVAWKAGTNLTISTLYGTGLMLMGTGENGSADIDMISMVSDTQVVRGILSTSGLPALQDPLTVIHNGDKSTNNNYGRIWAMTRSGSYFLDRKTMKATTTNKFGSIIAINENLDKETLTPMLYAPQIRDRAGNTGNSSARAIMTTDGNIFPSHTFVTGGDFYTNPINRLEADFEHLIPAAPYLWYSINNMSSVVWYDTENNRFLNYFNFGFGYVSSIPTDAGADPFPWNQASVGRTLVYGENTRNTDGGSTHGNSFAIMKDGAGNHYIYKFYANGGTPMKRDVYAVLPIASNFANADFYAFSSRRTVVFYSVGNTLYAYDYNKGFEKGYTLPETGGDEITMIKFDTQIDHTTNALYIATYNPSTKGRLRRFMLGTDPNTVTITPVEGADWDGLIKIKDMNWRAVN